MSEGTINPFDNIFKAPEAQDQEANRLHTLMTLRNKIAWECEYKTSHAYCRFCKSNNTLFYNHYVKDKFCIVTCDGCNHSRMQNDPSPQTTSPYNEVSAVDILNNKFKWKLGDKRPSPILFINSHVAKVLKTSDLRPAEQVFTSSENPGNPLANIAAYEKILAVRVPKQKKAKKGKQGRGPGKKGKNKRKRNTGAKSSAGLVAIAKRYVAMLTNPFANRPVKVGFGTLAPTGLACAYFRLGLTMNASTDGFVVHFNPDAAISGSASVTAGNAFSSASNSYISYGQYSGANGVATTFNQTTASNQVGLNSAADAFRVIAAAVRLIVTTASTAVAPCLFVKNWAGIKSVTATDTCTPNYCVSLPSTDMSPAGPASIVTGNWIPLDLMDFVMTQGNDNGAGLYNPVSAGFTLGSGAGTKVFIEAVTFIEYVEGDNVQSTEIAQPEAEGLNSYFSSIESAWNAVKSSVSYAKKISEFTGIGADIFRDYTPTGIQRGGLLIEEIKEQ